MASHNIFISYRREDAAPYARLISDELSDRFGDDYVFMDLETLEPGVDFVARIDEAVGSVDVLIAVIGPSWLTETDGDGNRRLDDPRDFVRLEIANALRRDIRVIPILVGGATMPEAEVLPEPLAGLTRRNALQLTDVQWKWGIDHLIQTLEKLFGLTAEEERVKDPAPTTKDPAPSTKDPEPRELVGATFAALLGAALLAVAVVLKWDEGHSYLQNDFGGHAKVGSFFTSLAPIAIVLGTVLGATLIGNRQTREIGAGLLLGFGVAGAAKYIGLVWVVVKRNESFGILAGSLIALAGAGLVLGVGLHVARAEPDGKRLSPNVPAAVLAVASAVLIAVGTLIPFNSEGRFPTVADWPWRAFDPIAVAFAIVIFGLLLCRPTKRTVWSAALLALGLSSALLWARYIGVPAIEENGTPKAGGFLGLAGAGLALAAGWLGYLSRASAVTSSP